MLRAPRFSIAGLMGVVLVASIGLAGLRNASATWAGVMFLLTCGVLALAVVGAACREGAARAWWLGFALFGWGFLGLYFWPAYGLPQLPTTSWTEALMAEAGARLPPRGGGVGFCMTPDDSGYQVGHCLWSLLAATAGGLLARSLFAVPTDRPENPSAVPQPPDQAPRGWWRRPVIIGLAGLIPVTSAILVGLRSTLGLGPWAGVTYLLTWGLLGVAALGAAYGRGRRRAVWLGATLFGAGYMVLVVGQEPLQQTWPRPAIDELVYSFLPWPPTVANARILKALEQPIPMRFPQETPLKDVLKYIEEATRGPYGHGIPIYVDPVGLLEAEKTMRSTLTINLEGVPLKTTLRLALKQLGLAYRVRDRLVVISCEYYEEEDWLVNEEPLLLIGHCLLGLTAAGLGGLVAPLVYEPRAGVAGGSKSP